MIWAHKPYAHLDAHERMHEATRTSRSLVASWLGGETTADHLKWTCPNGIMVEHYKVGSLTLGV